MAYAEVTVDPRIELILGRVVIAEPLKVVGDRFPAVREYVRRGIAVQDSEARTVEAVRRNGIAGEGSARIPRAGSLGGSGIEDGGGEYAAHLIGGRYRA